MATLADILNDPNYVNANAATKKAIFDKYSANDPNYTNANAATQQAIRTRFGVGSAAAQPQGDAALKSRLQDLGIDPAREYGKEFGVKDAAALAASIAFGPVAGGVTTLAARAVPALARFAPALSSGGAVGPNLGSRIAAGGLVGGGAAALSDTTPEGIGAGAATGAFLGPVSGAAAPYVARGYGAVSDFLRGNLADINAGRILRQAAGNQLGAIRAAGQAAPTNILASQATAEAGTPAFLSLLRMAEQRDPEATAFTLRTLQGQNQLAELNRIAGGGTQTQARAFREAEKRGLRELTDPMREAELEAANTFARLGRPLQAEAERAGAAASQAVEDVRRFTAAGPRAAQRAAGVDVMAQPETLPRQSYWERIGTRAELQAGEAAATSVAEGAARREAERRLASLEAQGLKPLDVSALQGRIRSMVNTPGIRVNQVQTQVLSNVADLIEQSIARNGGIIDARDLYGIRKDAVNDIIQKLYPNADAKFQNKYAGELLSKLKPMIDDAIESAGGKGWREYLKTFEEGMTSINRQQLGAKLKKAYEENPKKFRRIVEGNDPKEVEKVFGVGSYDIIAEMGDEYPALRKIADEMARDATVLAKAKEGAPAARDVLAANVMGARLPGFFSPKVTITNQFLQEVQSVVNKKTMDSLIRASQSGRAMNEVLDKLPFVERNRVVQFLIANPQFGAVAPATAGFFVGRENQMAPGNRNALVE